MLIYRDDLHGYDSLVTFTDLFNEYSKWTRALNQYLIGIKVEDNEYAEQIYNMTFNMYRTHFFKFENQATNYMYIAERIQVLYAQLEVGNYIKENAADIAGQNVINESYKTNNKNDESAPENNTRYRTNIEKTFTDNGDGELELKDRLANNANRIQSFVKDLRDLFMAETNEVQNKELYARGGKN